jgi:DNA-binding transcriptional LysR family regulator
MSLLSHIGMMNINNVDLNLLRVFHAVYRTRNVSRAAELLGLSQPSTSQALTRLRLLFKDALFVRVHGGVEPTPKSDRICRLVEEALSKIEDVLSEGNAFDPATSDKLFRIHLSDIGEARFLPRLMAELGKVAPHVRVLSTPWPHSAILEALDNGKLEFALGYLPRLKGTQTRLLTHDRYVVMVRGDHPALRTRRRLQSLDYVAVSSHEDTLQILRDLGVAQRVRLTASNFLALPDIVLATDLGVVLPRGIAVQFAKSGSYGFLLPEICQDGFDVLVHWSKRFDKDPSIRWMAGVLGELFTTPSV